MARLCASTCKASDAVLCSGLAHWQTRLAAAQSPTQSCLLCLTRFLCLPCNQVDVYSFAVLCWEMLTGRVPWRELAGHMQIIFQVGVMRQVRARRIAWMALRASGESRPQATNQSRVSSRQTAVCTITHARAMP